MQFRTLRRDIARVLTILGEKAPQGRREMTMSDETHRRRPRQSRKTRTGVVVSDKMQKTVTVQLDRRLAHPMYGKQVTRSKKVKARNEHDAKAGDTVRIMETRPLAKTVRWRTRRSRRAGALRRGESRPWCSRKAILKIADNSGARQGAGHPRARRLAAPLCGAGRPRGGGHQGRHSRPAR